MRIFFLSLSFFALVACTPQSRAQAPENKELLAKLTKLEKDSWVAVSYTHLTLPTICSV